jgi:catechol 2,3-dioxygenase-like lactoylglutathione lyase family enzyme
MVRVSRVHHVGVFVNDLERALAFYRDALGLPVVYQQPRMAMLSSGENHVELIEPPADAPVRSRPVEEWEGTHHLALETADVAGALAELAGKGAPLRSPEPRDLPHYRFAFLAPEAFEGVNLELVETTRPYDPVPPHPHLLGFDHVVVAQPDLAEAQRRFDDYFGLGTRREMNRTQTTRLAFLKAGRCVIELAGPRSDAPPAERRPGRLGGFVFEVKGIAALADGLRAVVKSVGEVHPAVQGGRIVSVHRSVTSGVPLAFIEYEGTAPAGTGLPD